MNTFLVFAAHLIYLLYYLFYCLSFYKKISCIFKEKEMHK